MTNTTNKEKICAEAYCDGSYNHKTGVYGFGVLLKIDRNNYEFSGHDDNSEKATMHNVVGEIDGVMCAINEAVKRGVTDLILYYDHDGIEKLAKANFMKDKMQAINIEFVHVEGHGGNVGNKRADLLARKAVGN